MHGTTSDFQGLADQERKLREAGVYLTNSNAAATRLAASMVLGKKLAEPKPYEMPKNLPKAPQSTPTRIYPEGVFALNLGLASFAEAPRKAGATVIHLGTDNLTPLVVESFIDLTLTCVDWKPPALGDRDIGLTLARMEDDLQSAVGKAINRANSEALQRIVTRYEAITSDS